VLLVDTAAVLINFFVHEKVQQRAVSVAATTATAADFVKANLTHTHIPSLERNAIDTSSEIIIPSNQQQQIVLKANFHNSKYRQTNGDNGGSNNNNINMMKRCKLVKKTATLFHFV